MQTQHGTASRELIQVRLVAGLTAVVALHQQFSIPSADAGLLKQVGIC